MTTDKMALEQEAGRRAVEAAAKRPALQDVERDPALDRVNDFGGVQIGPAPRAGGDDEIAKGRFVVMDVEHDPQGDLVAYVANRYADAETPRRGRPCEPETEVEIIAAATRVGGRISNRPVLLREIIATINGKGRWPDVEAVRWRVKQLQRLIADFKKSFGRAN
jgi:hypothetical protein